MAQVICPTCGNPSDTGYCDTCLAEIILPEEEASVAQECAEQGMPASEQRLSAPAQDDMRKRGNQGSCLDSLEDNACSARGLQSEEAGVVDAQEMRCPNCGMPGLPDTQCPQCGAQLPHASYQPDVCSAPQAVSLVFPNDLSFALVDGREYLLGRESEVPEIRQALAQSRGVSRRHCTICLQGATRSVLVRDENSMNGTFVGSSRKKVNGQEVVSLPTIVWLGAQVALPIDIEG